MLTVADSLHGAQAFAVLKPLLERAGLMVVLHERAAQIPGSYWGAPEAGLIGNSVHARGDTPLHSVLHESCHALCMSADRRRSLVRDAGGDDLEESAVCYLQLCIADCVDEIGWERLAADMDAWGYSFRAGSTAQWFIGDAGDARQWLLSHPHVTQTLPSAVYRRIQAGNMVSA